MTLLTQILRALAAQFDDDGYPSDVYFHLLQRVKATSSPAELGDALMHALAWKDRKVRRSPRGAHIALPSGTHYDVKTVKPNTLSERHAAVLRSDEFFVWAKAVRNVDYFEIELLQQLKAFGLWDSVVIPVFILHCLNPRIYPIVDRWVLMAYRMLSPIKDGSASKVSLDTYAKYQGWWLTVLSEANLAPMSAQLGQLKEMDAGLWVFGKRVASIAIEIKAGDEADVAGDDLVAVASVGTDSAEFKRRAVANRNAGKTQLQAIQDAAAELHIRLKPSYVKYPGSHFDRWKKQGIA